MDIESYEDIANYLMYSVPVFGKKSGLENITKLLDLLDNPERNISYIHVAGTNGKGSVCQMLSNVLCESKVKVGLFTSPHIVNINERIKINNENISDEKFVALFDKLKHSINIMLDEGYNHPTFFEIMFSMSLIYFMEAKVDVAIIETGIGGRLDTTNIIENPLISIITSIGYDHMDILGHSIEEITNEKAGIIKKGCNVVIGKNEKNIVTIIEEKAATENAVFYDGGNYCYEEVDRNSKGVDFSINNKYYNYDSLHMNIVADYQIENVATVLMAIEVLKHKFANINKKTVAKGLNSFYWPGRMEIVDENILLDGAHNTSGVKQFVQYVNKHWEKHNIILVFSILKSKDYKAVIKELSYMNINKLIVTEVTEKSVESKLLKEEFFNYNIDAIEENDIKKIIDGYNNNKDLLCFVGSLYLISEVKKII